MANWIPILILIPLVFSVESVTAAVEWKTSTGERLQLASCGR